MRNSIANIRVIFVKWVVVFFCPTTYGAKAQLQTYLGMGVSTFRALKRNYKLIWEWGFRRLGR
jgi:hypothetical protein